MQISIQGRNPTLSLDISADEVEVHQAISACYLDDAPGYVAHPILHDRPVHNESARSRHSHTSRENCCIQEKSWYNVETTILGKVGFCLIQKLPFF